LVKQRPSHQEIGNGSEPQLQLSREFIWKHDEMVFSKIIGGKRPTSDKLIIVLKPAGELIKLRQVTGSESEPRLNIKFGREYQYCWIENTMR